MTEQSGSQDQDDQPGPEEVVDFPPPNNKHAYLCFGVVFVVVNLAILGCAFRLIQVDTTGREGRVPAKLSAPTLSAEKVALQQAAEEMMKKVNATIDPCVDFYDFACGSWHNIDVKNSEQELSFLVTLQTVTDKRILKILQEPIDESDMPYTVQPRKFFAACKDTDRLKKLGSRPFLNFINNIGKFPILDPSWKESDFDLQDMVTKLAQLGFPVLFKVTVEPQGRYVILPPDTYTLAQNGRAYYNWTSITLAHLRLDAKVDENLHDFQEMFEVEAAIYEMKRYMEEDQGNTPIAESIPMKISQLQKNVPWLDWLKFFQNIYLEAWPHNKPVTADEYIVVGYPMFLLQMHHGVLKAFPKRALANFLMKSLLMFTAALDSRFMSLPAYIEAMVGKPRTDRTARCLMETKQLFPELVSRLYVEEFYEDKITMAVKEMFRNIKSAYIDSMDRTYWLTNSSKTKSKNKVAMMGGHIGYSECLKNTYFLNQLYSSVPTGEYFDAVKGLAWLRTSNLISRYRSGHNQGGCWLTKHAIDIGAFYDISTNYVQLSAASLQLPVFNPRWPLSMQYSGAGFLLAHDVMHALDSTGHQYNEAGILENWFPRDDMIVFSGKLRCLIAQFNGYTFQGQNISGSVTIDENLCDYQGLRESFKAYKQVLNRTMSKDLLLPGITLTSDQIFFTSYAQMLCQHIPPKMMDEAVKRSHAPNKFRVIGTLQNSFEFAEAFGCKLNSPMHPPNKCDLLS